MATSLQTTPPDSATRQRVLDAAAAICAASGANSLSIAGLTDESGVSNGSIYHHFGSRDGVIASLVLDAFSSYQEGLLSLLDEHQEDAQGGVESMVRYHLGWMEANPDLAKLLVDQRDHVAEGPEGGRLRDQNRQFFREVKAWLDGRAAAGQIEEVSIDLAHALVFAPAQELSRHWLSGRLKEKPGSHADRLASAAWAAMSSGTDAKARKQRSPR